MNSMKNDKPGQYRARAEEAREKAAAETDEVIRKALVANAEHGCLPREESSGSAAMRDDTAEPVRVETVRIETRDRPWGWLLKDAAGHVLIGSGPMFASEEAAMAAGERALLARGLAEN
jgi:hypothetical protein